jgi:hypothetical protein
MQIRPADQLQRFGLMSDVWMQFLVFADCPVFFEDQLGSIFHVHDSQWSRQIGPESILLVGRMVMEMDKVLGESGALKGEERRRFLSNVSLRFNAMVGHQCQQIPSVPEDAEVRRWLDSYLEFIYPHAGFAKFPLFPLFKQYRVMKDALDTAGAALRGQDARLREQEAWLQELQAKSDKLDQIGRSLVWRFSKPLRMVEDEVRRRIKGDPGDSSP